MINQSRTKNTLELLINRLSSKDGLIRQNVRESLVSIGIPAVIPLSRLMRNTRADKQIRWEAAKALGEIGNAKAIPSLVKALEDKDKDIAWLAADALEQFKEEAWPALFHVLLKRGAHSDLLRCGAHHVLRFQEDENHKELLANLKKSLNNPRASEIMMIAIYDILEGMKKHL